MKVLILVTLFCLAPSFCRGAAPSQNDVFKSIQDSMGKQKEIDPTPIVLLAAGGVGVLLVMSWMSRRRGKIRPSGALNHPRALTKELMREASLSSADLKQLKLLSDALEEEIGEPTNPVMLLLCPSLLARGLKEAPAKLDRKAVAQVVRKFKLNQTPTPR